ncbi:hypothetical protein KTE26_21985 [Ralstonia mannitolilytica]|uniref:hypothetical protein n=1 Tax=Ralstonia mannitolilytica TaxID=105219 RepID=UPI000CEF519E|nr:hypothetical protein [Ralstonia mannitolilytica]MBU9581108.1 hypothetical protein [Ralstonia mannitolilytica]
MEVDSFPRTLTEALALMQQIGPHGTDDRATLALSVLLSEEDGGVPEEVEMARWHFQYIESRWILLEAKLHSSSQWVGAELPLFEEQLLAVLTSKRQTDVSLYIGDVEKETYASWLVTLPEVEGDVLAAYIPSALVVPCKQRALELGYRLIS